MMKDLGRDQRRTTRELEVRESDLLLPSQRAPNLQPLRNALATRR
jgi:hypothetical protein